VIVHPRVTDTLSYNRALLARIQAGDPRAARCRLAHPATSFFQWLGVTRWLLCRRKLSRRCCAVGADLAGFICVADSAAGFAQPFPGAARAMSTPLRHSALISRACALALRCWLLAAGGWLRDGARGLLDQPRAQSSAHRCHAPLSRWGGLAVLDEDDA